MKKKDVKELFKWIWETRPKDLEEQIKDYEKIMKLETY